MNAMLAALVTLTVAALVALGQHPALETLRGHLPDINAVVRHSCVAAGLVKAACLWCWAVTRASFALVASVFGKYAKPIVAPKEAEEAAASEPTREASSVHPAATGSVDLSSLATVEDVEELARLIRQDATEAAARDAAATALADKHAADASKERAAIAAATNKRFDETNALINKRADEAAAQVTNLSTQIAALAANLNTRFDEAHAHRIALAAEATAHRNALATEQREQIRQDQADIVNMSGQLYAIKDAAPSGSLTGMAEDEM